MFRIDGPTAAPALSAPAAVSGTPGYFTSGDPAVPTPPTQVSADWLNMIQEELIAVVLGAGFQPQKNTSNQLFKAIQSLITSGGVAFATDAEAIAGQLADKAVSPRAAAALVANRIAAILGGAPANLATLGALAAALGNNPNFANDMVAALSARALAGLRISGGGLATGGGTLTEDLVLSVQAASGPEVNAGTEAGKAMTPASFAQAGGGDGASGWAPLPGGRMIQWGSMTVIGDGTSAREFQLNFPKPFLNVCGCITANSDPYSLGFKKHHPMAVMFNRPTIAGASGYLDSTDGDRPFSNSHTFWWQAIGQ